MEKFLKKLPIRKKFILIYVNMSVFTVPILLASYFAMRGLYDAGDPAEAAILNFFTFLYPIFIVVYLGVTIYIGRKLTQGIAFPMRDLEQAAKQLAEGDVDVDIHYDADDEIGGLTTEFNQMISAIKEQAQVLSVIAEGDYSGSITVRSDKDVINSAIDTMLKNNNEMISEIKTASEQVQSGAMQIADGSQMLATGSTEQAASVEKFSSEVEGVQKQAEENDKIATSTFEDTQEAGRLMGTSMEYMTQMIEAMEVINQSSQEIAKVIAVIDDIAFQTNILALNAAVEAARAGQHGKGFAVVAEEVRNLASKSADAAKETAALIDNSVQNVNRGSDIVKKTNDSLVEVGKIAQSNADSMQALSAASKAQASSIMEMVKGINEISEVVQANSATAEESAASAEEMSAQSNLLGNIVSRFKLKDAGEYETPHTYAPQVTEYGSAFDDMDDTGKYEL